MSSMDELFEEYWAWRLTEFPEFATFAGHHEHDDRLNDHSPQAYERRKTAAEGFLSRAKGFRVDAGEKWISVERLIDDLQVFLDGCKYDGNVFTVCYCEGMQIDFEQLASWMVFNTTQDYQRYVERLKALQQRLSIDQELLRIGIKKGKTFHAVSMKTVDDQIQALDVPVKDSVFYKPFLTVPDAIPSEEIAPLKEEAISVITDQVLPAFRKLKEFIEKEYLPACRPKEGVMSTPGGEEFYQEVLRWHLSLDMTPQQVHDLGIKEVDRIRKEMMQVIEEVGFKGDFKAFTDFLRSDPQFYYSSAEEALDGYRDVCYNKIRPTLGKIFSKIPESHMTIKAAPASRPDAPVGYYLAGTLDGSRPGTYYVNISNLSANSKYDMMTLSLHEGEPGHHFQGMYAIETVGVPSFRRYMEDMYYLLAPSRFPMHTAYAEGWGLYCEWLGNELGLYEDPYSRFGHLSFEMHRACRLVADTGIHAFGWDYDKTLKLFLENTALPVKFVHNEVQRYCTMPGQACAYKVGQLKIRELRDKAAKALGSAFDVKVFHDEVLQCGAVPMVVLEKIVDKYIENAKK